MIFHRLEPIVYTIKVRFLGSVQTINLKWDFPKNHLLPFKYNIILFYEIFQIIQKKQ